MKNSTNCFDNDTLAIKDVILTCALMHVHVHIRACICTFWEFSCSFMFICLCLIMTCVELVVNSF